VSLQTPSIELANALKAARQTWEDVRDVWKDAVARDFQERQWEPLVGEVEAVIDALNGLAPVLDRLRRDCS
jgi:hypothetical protein